MDTTATDQAPALRFSKARVIAARLGVCTRTLFRWADQGWISRHKVNARLVLFNEAEVESFIQSTRARFEKFKSGPEMAQTKKEGLTKNS